MSFATSAAPPAAERWPASANAFEPGRSSGSGAGKGNVSAGDGPCQARPDAAAGLREPTLRARRLISFGPGMGGSGATVASRAASSGPTSGAKNGSTSSP